MALTLVVGLFMGLLTAPPAQAAAKRAKAPVKTTSSPTTITLRWEAIAGAVSYRVASATDAKFDTNRRVDASSGVTFDLTGLQAATAYYVKVRGLNAKGKPVGPYSMTAKLKTRPLTDLRVGSYNVNCATCTSTSPDFNPWATRRTLVAANILAADLDVIGVQEATQGQLVVDGKKSGVSQYEDLVNLLGSPWKVSVKARYNCVRSTTPTDWDSCVPKDRGASGGARILYRSDRLTKIAAGSKKLSEASPELTDRFLAWAVFEQKSTGKRFFFATTHLEPLKDTGKSRKYYNTRVKQAKEIVAEIKAKNTDNLPVVMTGDLNSYNWSVPDNGPYKVLIGDGFADPLGNSARGQAISPTAKVRLNANFDSFNNYERVARQRVTDNGVYLDYILTKQATVLEWQTVVKVDQSGKFTGVIPSDHNLVRATLKLNS
ncbi:MAG: endonuclease/exonuclease/phosphatase family protein [Propionibacteriaceae bacterium]|jgi:endonuclease/exonuclease/phosphatase family metal-dependent hydrolase|nr:endonuclease/exonuclease/phosphatase family protein [Propionibacteriaceae bacterium]